MRDILSNVSSVVDSVPSDILKVYGYKETSTLFLFLKFDEDRAFISYIVLAFHFAFRTLSHFFSQSSTFKVCFKNTILTIFRHIYYSKYINVTYIIYYIVMIFTYLVFDIISFFRKLSVFES